MLQRYSEKCCVTLIIRIPFPPSNENRWKFVDSRWSWSADNICAKRDADVHDVSSSNDVSNCMQFRNSFVRKCERDVTSALFEKPLGTFSDSPGTKLVQIGSVKSIRNRSSTSHRWHRTTLYTALCTCVRSHFRPKGFRRTNGRSREKKKMRVPPFRGSIKTAISTRALSAPLFFFPLSAVFSSSDVWRAQQLVEARPKKNFTSTSSTSLFNESYVTRQILSHYRFYMKNILKIFLFFFRQVSRSTINSPTIQKLWRSDDN